MIGSATAAPGISIAMSAAIQNALCVIIVSFTTWTVISFA